MQILLKKKYNRWKLPYKMVMFVFKQALVGNLGITTGNYSVIIR
jgi:hypothetical protein